MSSAYRIRGWDKFLGDKMRNRKGACQWLKLPVRLHDLDYIAIASGPDGAAVLGVWLALLELAGTLKGRDGVLVRGNGTPLTLDEMSATTRLPKGVLAKGLERLSECGWIVGGTVPNRVVNATNDDALEERRVEGEKEPLNPQGDFGGGGLDGMPPYPLPVNVDVNADADPFAAVLDRLADVAGNTFEEYRDATVAALEGMGFCVSETCSPPQVLASSTRYDPPLDVVISLDRRTVRQKSIAALESYGGEFTKVAMLRDPAPDAPAPAGIHLVKSRARDETFVGGGDG